MKKRSSSLVLITLFLLAYSLFLSGCLKPSKPTPPQQPHNEFNLSVTEQKAEPQPKQEVTSAPPPAHVEETTSVSPEETYQIKAAEIGIKMDIRDDFIHGEKTAEYQKYIVLHDTEGDSEPQSVVDWWAGNGNLIAAHFVIGKDGHVVQCVPLDKIAHHAGWGSDGHNEKFEVTDESRDDLKGRKPTSRYTDYGMNSYSIGIELVHKSGSGDYPQEQLESLDKVIALIDEYYGFESTIIDHKMWRLGNSDTSPEFADYLANYQAYRSYRQKN